MNIKHSIIALGAAGATAALVFGGSAVSTAFTSADNGSLHADSATVTSTLTNGDLALNNAIPGDHVDKTVSWTNTGSVPTELVLTFGSLQNAGANPSALASDLDVIIGGQTVPVTGLAGQRFDLGKIQPSRGYTAPVVLKLSDNAGNEAQGSNVTLPYTLTATATH